MKNSIVGPDCVVSDSDGHIIDAKEKYLPIVIGDNVWISRRVKFLKCVTIGDGATIATGSVVTKNILQHSLVAGIPANIIKGNLVWRYK